jgi:hypothetical protein
MVIKCDRRGSRPKLRRTFSHTAQQRAVANMHPVKKAQGYHAFCLTHRNLPHSIFSFSVRLFKP